MNLELARRLFELLQEASAEEAWRIFSKMTPGDLLKLDALFELWAHEAQLPPKSEGWRVWLMMAGRGFGKTRAGAEWVHGLASAKAGLRIALVGASIADARTIMVEGVSGLLRVAGNYGRRLQWEPSLGRLTWPNGSSAQLFSGDHADGLRGPEHDVAWFLTFEIFADEGPILVSNILRDASNGLIDCGATDRLSGYAAYGRSLKAAIQPLVDTYAIDLFDDGAELVEPADVRRDVSADQLANSIDRRKVSRVQREQVHARSLPSVVRLGYYDAALDYQAGEARAASAQRLGTEEQREFPGVVTAATAKSLAHQMIARAWAMRDKLTVRLPPRFLDLQPGSRIGIEGYVGEWAVTDCTIDGFVVVAELRPDWKPAVSMAADAGRVVGDKDAPIANVQLALIEAPGLIENGGTSPTVLLAASSAYSNWRSCAVQILAGTQSFAAQTASRKTILGHAETPLGTASPDTVDLVNSVDVHLIDEQQWFLSCDEVALAEGANLAVIGSEVIQFGEVEPLGKGRFRLRHLLRGRSGTEGAIGTHQSGEVFALVQRDALRAVGLPQWTIGSAVKASARNVGGAVSESREITIAGPQRDVIISPEGGDIVDDRARASIEQILSAMRERGMIAD